MISLILFLIQGFNDQEKSNLFLKKGVRQKKYPLKHARAKIVNELTKF